MTACNPKIFVFMIGVYMKKTLLAALIAASITIAGCEDKETIQKLQNAEKTIIQLENELKTTKANLDKNAAEMEILTQLKSENETLKDELTKAQQNIGLRVEIVKIFDKQEIIKHKVDPKEEFPREESEIISLVTIPKTNLAWLNELLIKEAYDINEEVGRTIKNPTEQDLRNSREKIYKEMVESAKEEPVIGYDDSLTSSFLAQRNNIATFTMQFYSYSGGAHGMHYTHYINFDLNKKSIINLDDLVSPQNQAQFKEMLWANYRNNRLDENGKYTGFAEQKDFRISPDFYFAPHGLIFVYPPYELGPYVEGDVEVEVSWYEINDLLKPEYRPTEKDGFFMNESGSR